MDIAAHSKPLDGLSIFILEDEFIVAFALIADFEDAGAAEVHLARTLEEARAKLPARCDCAVLDVRVPDGMSYEFAKELLSAGTPVVFHSGHADELQLSHFPRAVYCGKPSMPEDVIRAINCARSSG